MREGFPEGGTPAMDRRGERSNLGTEGGRGSRASQGARAHGWFTRDPAHGRRFIAYYTWCVCALAFALASFSLQAGCGGDDSDPLRRRNANDPPPASTVA